MLFGTWVSLEDNAAPPPKKQVLVAYDFSALLFFWYCLS